MKKACIEALYLHLRCFKVMHLSTLMICLIAEKHQTVLLLLCCIRLDDLASSLKNSDDKLPIG